MSQLTYWIISMCFAGVALLVSLASLALNWKGRKSSDSAVLLEKKTELLTKLVEAKSIFGHLELIFAQQLLHVKADGSNRETEVSRIKNNLQLLSEQSTHFQEQYDSLRDEEPEDIGTWESMLITANSFIAHSSRELEKEQAVLDELRNEVNA